MAPDSGRYSASGSFAQTRSAQARPAATLPGQWTMSGTCVPAAVVVVLAAVLAWWVTLLLFSRTFANLLGALATGRLQQVAQASVPMRGLQLPRIAGLAVVAGDALPVLGLRGESGRGDDGAPGQALPVPLIPEHC